MLNLIQAIDETFKQTDKEFVTFDAVSELLGRDLRSTDLDPLIDSQYRWSTKVVSGHGFLPEYIEKYNREAKVNIPLIYFGIGGFENYEIGGGCAYCIHKLK